MNRIKKKLAGTFLAIAFLVYGTALLAQTAEDFWNNAMQEGNKGDWSGAIENFDKVIELEPKNVNAYIMRGAAKTELGDWQGAIKDFTQAIKLDPENVQAFYYRGYSRESIHDKKGAAEDYAKVSKLDPDYAKQRGILNSGDQNIKSSLKQ